MKNVTLADFVVPVSSAGMLLVLSAAPQAIAQATYFDAIVRFDPADEKFTSYPSNRSGARVRQMLGRAGEAWGAESGTDRLVRIP